MKQYAIQLSLFHENGDILYNREYVHIPSDPFITEQLEISLDKDSQNAYAIIENDLKNNPASCGRLLMGHFHIARAVDCVGLIHELTQLDSPLEKVFEKESDTDFSTNYKVVITFRPIVQKGAVGSLFGRLWKLLGGKS